MPYLVTRIGLDWIISYPIYSPKGRNISVVLKIAVMVVYLTS